MKVYISGAITNNPNYKEQFKAAEERLKLAGHFVINPATNQGYTYKEYIDMGLFELMHCEAIYMLRGWENSTGAKLELEYAKEVGLEIMYQSELAIDIVKLNTINPYYCSVCGKEVNKDDEYCSYCGRHFVRRCK